MQISKSVMASATMGLRRRVTVNSSGNNTGSSSPSNQSQMSSSSKRSRPDNNNSPSQGNLNSLGGSRDEPPVKKSRGTSTSKNTNSGATYANGESKGKSVSTSKSQGKGCSTTIPSTTIATSSSSGSAAANSSSSSSASSSSPSSSSTVSQVVHQGLDGGLGGVLPATSWPAGTSIGDAASYSAVTGLGMGGSQAALCAGGLGIPSPIPYMSTSMATFVGNATNLGKSSSISYLDISNMTASSGGYTGNSAAVDAKSGLSLGYPGQVAPPTAATYPTSLDAISSSKKFQNDGMFNTYQPWVIKTYGDLAKTKTITIKKYARILRTLRGEEVNSAENSKFRFWVKSKGFHIGQPDGYDAKPADRIIGRHAVTSPGLDPPLYVPTQLPHNKSLNGAEGTVPPGKVYKKVAIVENFFDIIHAVHVDLEGRPGKHAGQKRTYRTITETYAFLPREAVTRFLLGCTECQRRPRTPSPTNLSSSQQPHTNTPSSVSAPSTLTATPLSPTPGTALSASPGQSTPKLREASHPPESKSLFNYRNPKHQKSSSGLPPPTLEKTEKERDEKYNPLSITNLLKKEPTTPSQVFTSGGDSHLAESRKTPESDRASSRSSASSKRRRMLPEGRTPSPQPSAPLPRPWSPGLDPKNTPIDYSLPITTTYLKHQQRLIQAEKNKSSASSQAQDEPSQTSADFRNLSSSLEAELESEMFSNAAGLIDTNLNLLATIHHLHCQVMLALTERLRPSVMPGSLVLPSTSALLPGSIIPPELSVMPGQNHA